MQINLLRFTCLDIEQVSTLFLALLRLLWRQIIDDPGYLMAAGAAEALQDHYTL